MINTVVICGAGTMGSGIAELCALGGFHTVLYDLDGNTVNQRITQIHLNLDKRVAQQKLSAASASEAKSLLHGSADISHCIGDIVIEVIVEKLDTKRALFNQLAEINHSDTIFASNTSSLSISQIAEGVVHPERVCGLHFFNPAQVMKLVEIVSAEKTRENIIIELSAFCRQLGKTAVVCKDSPGFIVNRIARHYYLEPLRLMEQGLCDIHMADALMEDAGFKMGPFKLMDLIGNDVNYAVSDSLYQASGQEERFRPSQIQKDLVDKGSLGRKTGQGFYRYT